MVLEAIKAFKHQDYLSVLDVGAADGYMLGELKESLNASLCLGIEPSLEAIKSNVDSGCLIIQAFGEGIPFKDNAFDVIIAASVLDHLKDYKKFLRECQRVLKSNGMIVITLVSPFYDKVAVRFKVKEDDHVHHFTENRLAALLKEEDFDILKISRFGLPFFGDFPNTFIEKTLNFIGMGKLMFYIIAVASVKDKHKI